MYRVVEHSVVDGTEDQRVQRVDVDVEGQHDPLGQEGVRLALVPGEEREPDLHARPAAAQPQGLQEVTLLLVGPARRPDVRSPPTGPAPRESRMAAGGGEATVSLSVPLTARGASQIPRD